MPVHNKQLEGNPRRLPASATDPSVLTGEGAWYVKIVSGVAEGFYKDDQGNAIQMTNNGSINASGSSISDAAYSGSWNTDTTNGASKNALYAKLNAMDSSISANTAKVSASGSVTTHSDVGGAAPTDGQVLTWVNANSRYEPATPSGGGGGSVLDGAYPTGWDGDTTNAPSRNAVFDKVNTMDTAISANTSKVSADGSVSTHSDVGGAAPTDGQVLTWVNANSRYEPATPSAGGSVTTYAITLDIGADLATRLSGGATSAPAGWTLNDAGTAAIAGLHTGSNDLAVDHDLTAKLPFGITVYQFKDSGPAATQRFDYINFHDPSDIKSSITGTAFSIADLITPTDATFKVKILVQMVSY
jgi:hypothetical protein